jgi:hypothetical protein
MPRTPGEVKELLSELELDMQLAIAGAKTNEEIREYTELQRAIADLQDRVAQLIDAGIEFISSLWKTIEEAADEFWRWLTGK